MNLTKQNLFLAFWTSCLVCAAATAGTINLNDTYNGGAPFDGDSVMYIDVEETNDATFNYYRDPTMFGDDLDLNPTGLRTETVPGPGADSITTDLSMIVMADPGLALDVVAYTESGDWEVLGTAVASSTLDYTWSVVGGVGGGFGSVSTSQSAPPNDSDDWTLDFIIDVASVNANANKIELTFTNTLETSADDLVSAAFISKKTSRVSATTMVPEPTAGMLGLLSLSMLFPLRRRD